MKLLINDLGSYTIQKLVISSLEQALYQAIVVIDDTEHVVWESEQKVLRSRKLLALREHFANLDIPETTLRHESPYDEMIGQPTRLASNRMEVPLSPIG